MALHRTGRKVHAKPSATRPGPRVTTIAVPSRRDREPADNPQPRTREGVARAAETHGAAVGAWYAAPLTGMRAPVKVPTTPAEAFTRPRNPRSTRRARLSGGTGTGHGETPTGHEVRPGLRQARPTVW